MKDRAARLAVAAVLAVLPATEARADDCFPRTHLSTCLPADNLWPSASGPFTWLAPSSTVAPRTVAFGALLDYVYRPVGLTVASADPDGTAVYAVEHAITLHLLASIGVSSRLAFDVAAPIRLYQLGAGTGFATGSDDALPKSAVGDLRFGPVVSILRHRGARGLDLAARLHMLAPTGHPRAFISSPSATFAPGVSFSYWAGRVAVSADAGARIRNAVELGGGVVGTQISFGAGVSVEAVRQEWLRVAAEAFALFDIDRQTTQFSAPTRVTPDEEPNSLPLIPAEWMLSARSQHLLDGHLRATLGVGGLIPTGPTTAVTAPAFRAVASLGFVP